LAERLFEQRVELLRRTRAQLEACRCEDGCPACIGPVAGTSTAPRKPLCLDVLAALGIEGVH
jgi:DEAD/DEAH box helicase domain-containing protein